MAKMTKDEFLSKVQSKRHANSFPRTKVWRRLTVDLGLSRELAKPVFLAMAKAHYEREGKVK